MTCTYNKYIVLIILVIKCLTASCNAAGELKLATEKTQIPKQKESSDCDNNKIKAWSFEQDKPIESPCKLTRTRPPIELGPKLLGLGKIEKGIKLPTNAIWQPALYLIGNFRSSLNYLDLDDRKSNSELAFRADVFLNLQLSATERVVLGLTPFNKGNDFTNYQFSPNDGWNDGMNSDINTFWFEGDLGELFPNAKNNQRKKLDLGFSFGRQTIAFQDGIMTNDKLDSLVLVKNNMHITTHAPSTRMSFLYAWNNIHRNLGVEDTTAKFYGIFTQTDTWNKTIEFDLAYLSSDLTADGYYIGLSSTQRIGHWGSTLRVNSSIAAGEESANIQDGTLITVQLNRNLKASHNVFYLNGFVGIDQYSSATRASELGGPLGLIGISYASPGIGNFGSAINNNLDDSYGFASGVQWFFNKERTNLILELAHMNTDTISQNALSARFQMAFGRRWQWQIDTFLADQSGQDHSLGIRSELGMRF